MTGIKFQNTRNFKVALFVSHDDVRKTTMLEYVDTGKSFELCDSTLKRWWKKVEGQEEGHLVPMPGAEKLQELKEEYSTECPDIDQEELDEIVQASEMFAGDGTPYTDVMKEIQEGAKQKAEEASAGNKKPSKSSVDVMAHKQEILHILDGIDGISYLVYEKIPGLIVIKKDNKSIIEVRVTRKGATFNCKESMVLDGLTFDTVSNYYMPYVLRAESNYMDIFDRFLTILKEEK